jgi:DNA-binding NarL/FixJ family response regulator
MKVLIADDSEHVCRSLTALLSRIDGIEVTGQAAEVSEAINKYQELKPDVIILDIRMPGGSGIDVLRHIKKDNVNSVVIIVTNYPYPQYRKKCLELGANFFFDKSTDFDKIPIVLKQLQNGVGNK